MGFPVNNAPQGQPQITPEMIDKELEGIARQIEANSHIMHGCGAILEGIGLLRDHALKFVPKGEIRAGASNLLDGLAHICEGAKARQSLNLDMLAAHREQWEQIKAQISSPIVVPRTVIRQQ